jgi:hypothetical protein
MQMANTRIPARRRAKSPEDVWNQLQARRFALTTDQFINNGRSSLRPQGSRRIAVSNNSGGTVYAEEDPFDRRSRLLAQETGI